MTDEGKMTFLEHLEELRKRLIICIASIFAGMIICWFFRDQLLSFLLAPLYEAWQQVEGLEEPRPLNYSSMLEPFVANLKLSAIGGVFVSAPLVLYQLWEFISPGLYPKERRMALPFVVISTVLFVGGAFMAYSTVFPIGFRFFLEFASGQDMTVLPAFVTLGEGTFDEPEKPPATAPPLLPEKPSSPVVAAGDAGPDASAPEEDTAPETPVKTRADPPAAPIAHRPPRAQEAEPEIPGITEWFESLARRVFTANCADFTATPSATGESALLTVMWQKARCGEFQKIVVVNRDGKRLAPTWSGEVADEPGVWRFTSVDSPAAGAHEYTVKFPSNPNANRLAPVLMVKDYLSFAVRILLAFGIIFELPILISFLAIAGIVNYRQLIQFFRYFFVVAVVVGAMLTPPDVITQLLLALPLVVLYAISILVAYFFGDRPPPDK